MKLSEMTDEQKSRLIAELIEPIPDYQPVITDSISGITIYTDRPSVTAAWKYKFEYTRVPSQMSANAIESGAIQEEIGEWQPRDMTEPAMTVMLIKELLRGRDYECIISQDEIEMYWRPSVSKADHSFMVSLIKNTLEQGVVNAFMLANGFEEE